MNDRWSHPPAQYVSWSQAQPGPQLQSSGAPWPGPTAEPATHGVQRWVQGWWAQRTHGDRIVLGVLAAIALVVLIACAINSGGPDWTPGQQALISDAHSVGIRPLDDQTIVNVGEDMCANPNDIVSGLVPVEMWGPTRATWFGRFVFADLCPGITGD